MIAAKGKPGSFMLGELKRRLASGDRAAEQATVRAVLAHIAKSRLAAELEAPAALQERLEAMLGEFGVPGLSVAVMHASGVVTTICAGEAASGRAMMPDVPLQIASLSKTVASAFAIQYLYERGTPVTASVNALLREAGCEFTIEAVDGGDSAWGDAVTVAMLMNHTAALGGHYVNGGAPPLPGAEALATGTAEARALGYEPIRCHGEPGRKMAYSGAGFIVLTLLVEALEALRSGEKTDLAAMVQEWLHDGSTEEWVGEFFASPDSMQPEWAVGHRADLSPVPRLDFPTAAAGMWATPRAVAGFMRDLVAANASLLGAGGIMHETAAPMLQSRDAGSMAFMGAEMGLGVFVRRGPNGARVALHQASNDGFGGVYLVATGGLDAGRGFVVLNNGDNNGHALNCAVLDALLRHYRWAGVDYARLGVAPPVPAGTTQENIVNTMLRDRVLDAFVPMTGERYPVKGPLQPLAAFDRAANARVLRVTDDRFAPADNLFSPHEPVFDGELFGTMGKTMDSWESGRHNTFAYDELVAEMAAPCVPVCVEVSTKWHYGNSAEAVEVLGRAGESEPWRVLVAKAAVDGHATRRFPVAAGAAVRDIAVRNYPDGGISRVRVYDAELPEAESRDLSRSFLSDFPIPTKATKPAAAAAALVRAGELEWQRSVVRGSLVNVASAALGARIADCSDQHYGPAAAVLDPAAPRGMHDGFESARSRGADHVDFVAVRLARSRAIDHIVLDMTYFVNNNPRAVEVWARRAGDEAWAPMVLRRNIKAFAGNLLRLDVLDSTTVFDEVRVVSVPDGGFNRVRIYAYA